MLTEKCVYHIFSGYNQNMDSCYNQRVNRQSFFRANKCHFFSVAQGRTTFKLLMALCLFKLNRVRKQHTAPKCLSSGKFSRVSFP